MKTAKYEFFYGTQTTEFERPKVPKIITEKGLKANIKPTKTSVVILNVCNKAK